MRKRHIRAGLVCLAGVAGSAAANVMAQGPGQQPRLVLQALDADHDGKLSAAEIKNAPQALLTLDLNQDGQLTQDELQPRRPDAGASADELVKQLMSFDKNGDGVLTADELPARMANMFKRGDTDHDGKLTAAEIRAMTARQGVPAGPATERGRAEGMMRTDALLNALDSDHDGIISAAEIAAASTVLLALDVNHDGEITADEMRVRQQTPAERVEHMLDEWDTNKDGRISKEEAPDRMQQQFSTIDKNGDGFLDKDELAQYFSSMANGGGRRPAEGTGAPAPKEGKQ